MKLASEIAKTFLPEKGDGKVVEFIAVIGGWKKLQGPTISTDLQCPECGNQGHYTPLVDPNKDATRVWICSNGLCMTNSKLSMPRQVITPTKVQRAIEWSVFAEINGIGNLHHDIKFEDVDQSDAKRSYMLKFVSQPQGIIFMQGEAGLGKSFASMAMCEMFTRRNTSCIFTTQRKMTNDWLETFQRFTNYVEKVNNCALLVIDDFGTAELPPGFLSFFMDLINTRMQWNNRGTVITTNLDDKKFGEFCGDALIDRINTGQKFKFEGKTRRIKKPI